MAIETIRMTHPHLPGQDIHVPPDVVDGHRRMGWVPDTDGVDPEPAAEATPTADTEPVKPPVRRAESPTAATKE